MANDQEEFSPRWGPISKVVVGFTIILFIGILVIVFRDLLGPLLVSFIAIYLLYPAVNFIRKILNSSWALAVNLLFLGLIAVLAGLTTWGGITLVYQVINLFTFLQEALVDFPGFLNNLTLHDLVLGPFRLNPGQLISSSIGNQLIAGVQPLLVAARDLVSGFAAGAANMLGWLFFEIVISYFILSGLEGGPSRMFDLPLPGYQHDIDRMREELEKIWDAFLRGQITIIALIILLYLVMLGPLGLSYFYALALVAGLARFVPYVGTGAAWLSFGLVAFFQGYTQFGLAPFPYALLVVGIVITVDTLFDNLVSQRIMANTLQVHPAAVLIAALMGFYYLGIIGVILAAPVLATIRLFFRYALRKLFDQDPWEGLEQAKVQTRSKFNVAPIIAWFRKKLSRVQKY